MNTRPMRQVLLRAAIVLGLMVAVTWVPAMLAAAPVTAQDLDQPQPIPPSNSAAGSPPAQSGQPPAQSGQPAAQPSENDASEADEDEEQQPPTTTNSRPGTGPAFSPSGGSSSGAGSNSGSPASAPSSGPAPKPVGFSPAPPPLADPSYENALKDEKVFSAGRCFGGKAFTQYVGEGFKLRVMGRCALLLDETWIAVPAKGVKVGDGEVALDFKLLDGASRSRVGLYVRSVDGRMIGAHFQPTKGEASLFTLNEGKETELKSRYDLFSAANPGEWNKMAVRVAGHDVWLLINDEPVLHSGGVDADAGGIIVELIREGNVDDEEESSIVVRNLVMAPLEGGEAGRGPTGP